VQDLGAIGILAASFQASVLAPFQFFDSANDLAATGIYSGFENQCAGPNFTDETLGRFLE